MAQLAWISRACRARCQFGSCAKSTCCATTHAPTPSPCLPACKHHWTFLGGLPPKPETCTQLQHRPSHAHHFLPLFLLPNRHFCFPPLFVKSVAQLHAHAVRVSLPPLIRRWGTPKGQEVLQQLRLQQARQARMASCDLRAHSRNFAAPTLV